MSQAESSRDQFGHWSSARLPYQANRQSELFRDIVRPFVVEWASQTSLASTVPKLWPFCIQFNKRGQMYLRNLSARRSCRDLAALKDRRRGLRQESCREQVPILTIP